MFLDAAVAKLSEHLDAYRSQDEPLVVNKTVALMPMKYRSTVVVISPCVNPFERVSVYLLDQQGSVVALAIRLNVENAASFLIPQIENCKAGASSVDYLRGDFAEWRGTSILESLEKLSGQFLQPYASGKVTQSNARNCVLPLKNNCLLILTMVGKPTEVSPLFSYVMICLCESEKVIFDNNLHALQIRDNLSPNLKIFCVDPQW